MSSSITKPCFPKGLTPTCGFRLTSFVCFAGWIIMIIANKTHRSNVKYKKILMKKIVLITFFLFFVGCSLDKYRPITERDQAELDKLFDNMRQENRLRDIEIRIERIERGYDDFYDY